MEKHQLFKIGLLFNYCGGDEEIYISTKTPMTEIEFQEAACRFADEVAGELAYERFGCALGDYISDWDEEEGNEELNCTYIYTSVDSVEKDCTVFDLEEAIKLGVQTTEGI